MKFYPCNFAWYSLLLLHLIMLTSSLKSRATSQGYLAQPAVSPVSGYYYIQKFYSGNEPEKFLMESEKTSQRKFVTLSQQMIYYSKSATNADILEGKLFPIKPLIR